MINLYSRLNGGRPSDARPGGVARRLLCVAPALLLMWGAASGQEAAPARQRQAEGESVASAAPAKAAGREACAADADAPGAKSLAAAVAPAPSSIPRPTLSRLGVAPGQVLPLTLDEAVRRALENNNDIEMSRQDVRVAETGLLAAESAYDPVFSLGPQWKHSASPQANSLSGSDRSGTVTETDLTFSQSVKKLVGRGADYELFFDGGRRSTSSTYSTLDPVSVSTLGLTYTQPLLRGREIDATRYAIQIQRKRVEQSDAEFRQRVVEIISGVQQTYWDLVFALREQQNQIAYLDLARNNLGRVETSIKAGATAPLELTEMKAELSLREAGLLSATQNVSVAENNLKRLFLADGLAPEWSASLLPTDEPAFDGDPVNLDDALREARAARPELRSLRAQDEINRIDLKYLKDQTRPRLDLQVTVASTGLAGSPAGAAASSPAASGKLVGGYGRSLLNMTTLGNSSVAVGVTYELPWGNRRAKAELAGAASEGARLESARRAEELNVEVEVRNAAQALETARLKVLASRAARDGAEGQLAGERKLYEVGRSSSFLLIQRESQLFNARAQQLRAEIDYNKALAQLQRSTSSVLRAHNVSVETANGR